MASCISPLTIGRGETRNVVPCGKCNFCLETNRNAWTFRLRVELRHAHTAHFLNLTYSDENLPWSEHGVPELRKNDLQRFNKRLRKLQSTLPPIVQPDQISTVVDAKIRYYAVGEYGTETERPHYHSIIFNVHPLAIAQLPKLWPHGHTVVGTVEPASIHYVTKYVINRIEDIEGLRQKPFALISRGIGSTYLQTHGQWHNDHKNHKRFYVVSDGMKQTLPRYYKDKLFNSQEKAEHRFKTLVNQDVEYWERVDQAAPHHADPQSYLETKTRYRHDSITSKINKKNKL